MTTTQRIPLGLSIAFSVAVIVVAMQALLVLLVFALTQLASGSYPAAAYLAAMSLLGAFLGYRGLRDARESDGPVTIRLGMLRRRLLVWAVGATLAAAIFPLMFGF